MELVLLFAVQRACVRPSGSKQLQDSPSSLSGTSTGVRSSRSTAMVAACFRSTPEWPSRLTVRRPLAKQARRRGSPGRPSERPIVTASCFANSKIVSTFGSVPHHTLSARFGAFTTQRLDVAPAAYLEDSQRVRVRRVDSAPPVRRFLSLSVRSPSLEVRRSRRA